MSAGSASYDRNHYALTRDHVREVFKRAVVVYGVAPQVTTAMEELGELTAALNQFFFRDRISVEELAGEVADVELVIEQIRVLIGDHHVDVARIGKMGRFEERIYRMPPCMECGAKTEAEASVKCNCGGDKDHCHGCEVWP